MASDETPVAAEAVRAPWAMLFGAWLLVAMVAAFQIVPAGILPVIMADMAIGPAVAGGLVSASLAAQAVFNIPVGVAIDRTSNRLMLTVATAAMVVAGLWGWQAAGAGAYWSLIAAIVLGGGGIATVVTAGANLIGGSFDEAHRATAVGLFITGPPSGYAIAPIVGPFIANRAAWGLNFAVFGGASLVAFAVFWATSRGVDTGSTGASSPTWGDFRRVFTSRAVWTICAMSFAAYSLYLFFNSWMPTYLNTEFEVGLVTSGLFTAVFPAIGIIGRGSSGLISDRVFGGRRRPVALGTFAVTVPVVAVIASLRTAIVLVVFMVLAGFFVQLAIGLFYTYVQETVEDNVTGTALALFGLVSFMGAFTAPAVAGVLIERTGAYLAAFGYAGLLALAGVALATVAPRN